MFEKDNAVPVLCSCRFGVSKTRDYNSIKLFLFIISIDWLAEL